MKRLDLSKYALMLENNAFVVEATPAMAATREAAKSLATPVDTDTAAVKAVKTIINDPTGKKAQYDSIISQLEPFIFSQDAAVTNTTLKFKEGEVDYEVIVNRAVDPKGNYMVWFDEDGTKILIDGLDMTFLATQFRRGVEGTSIFGLNFGTDEDKLAAIAGAIYSTAAGANADPGAIFNALNQAYTAAYQEDMYEAIDGEFTGSPDAFARALYGQQITEDDISAALGVDFLQSLVLDVVIGVATFGVGAAARGLFTGARAIRAAGAVNKLKGTATAFRSGLAGNATGVGIRGGANVATLAAGALVAPTANAASKVKAAVAYDIGGRGDKSFNDSAAEGLDRAVAEFGLEAKEVTVTTGSESEREDKLRLLAKAGYNPIIAVGFLYAGPIKTVATDYPNISFAIIDDSSVQMPNVSSLVFAEEQGSYLVGVAAALASKSGKVSYIGGVRTPQHQKFEAADRKSVG
jgi:hypothetical protein